MKLLTLLLLALALVLNACSPLTIASSSGESPAPVVEVEPVQSDATPAPVLEGTGYQRIRVVDMTVEVGVGSPVPVVVDLGADLPDVCAQVEYVEQKQDGSTFNINVYTIPSTDEDCLRDTVPFRMRIPLNVVGLPAGDYSVEVNNMQADSFTLDSGSATASLPTADTAIAKDDIQVDDVSIRVGRGSPLPVHAVVSANLPRACAQLGEVRMHRDGNTFFVRLIANVPAQTDCVEDSLPFTVELPLNLIGLPDGTYEVNVNGTVGTFEIPVLK